MALTAEQRALLELVQDRGLTYEEIGELTGTGAHDARKRVEAAVAAREGEVPSKVRLVVVIALAGIALVAGVLALAGVFEGDGEEGAAPPLATQPAAGDQEVARIELSETGGSTATGIAIVGIGADNSPYLDLDLAGLEPAGGGGFHMLWVDVDDGRGVPLPEPIVVAADGTFSERLPLPVEIAGVLEVGRSLELVVTDRRAMDRVSQGVARAGARSRRGDLDPSDLPERPGEVVLQGQVAA